MNKNMTNDEGTNTEFRSFCFQRRAKCDEDTSPAVPTILRVHHHHKYKAWSMEGQTFG